ncbi:hypothetical protein D3C79_906590 [compost metagenome]
MIRLLEAIQRPDHAIVHLPLTWLIDEEILMIYLKVFEFEFVVQLVLPLLG